MEVDAGCGRDCCGWMFVLLLWEAEIYHLCGRREMIPIFFLPDQFVSFPSLLDHWALQLNGRVFFSGGSLLSLSKLATYLLAYLRHPPTAVSSIFRDLLLAVPTLFFLLEIYQMQAVPMSCHYDSWGLM